MNDSPPSAYNDLWDQIIGQDLSGVNFVRDYIQLQFNPPPSMNALTPVTVSAGNNRAKSGDANFPNMIVQQIGKVVSKITIKDKEDFLIVFEDSSTISISLKPEDYVCPEAINFFGPKNQLAVF